MARPSPGHFANMDNDADKQGLQDDGGGEAEMEDDEPPRETPRSRAFRLQQRSSNMDSGHNNGLEVVAAVVVQHNDISYHSRRLLKRKEKVSY